MKKKLANNVAHFYISKPFFKNCLYKLEYNFNESAKPGSPMVKDVYWGGSVSSRARRALWDKTRAFARAVKRYATEHEFEVRVRAEGSHVSIFVQNEEDAMSVINKYRTKLSAIWMPFNETQVVMIDDDLNATLVFRNSLFCSSNQSSGYRYKVQCKVSNEVKASWLNVNEFVKKLDRAEFKANENWYKIPKDQLSYWNTFSMYFNDEQDIMMLKLMLGSNNFKLQKAVLYSELE